MALNIVTEIKSWGRTIGAAARGEGDSFVTFQYDPAFIESGIELSPLVMPLSARSYRFPELAMQTFHGLPGLIADSLPDKFGNAVIDRWLATQRRTPESFSALERLCYTGTRGMGALEFYPASGPKSVRASKLDIDRLVLLASEILSYRRELAVDIHDVEHSDAMRDILRVGTSAGGARAKAVIAWNRKTNEVRSGQVTAGQGFTYWLLKFDGVSNNLGTESGSSQGYGSIEYAYYLMAKAAGVTMSECRLLEEHGRRHFMTRRFDRLDDGEKLNMQSLCALAHYDFNMAGAFSYEQAFQVIRRLKLPMSSIEEQFRRMAFNIVAYNQDDHVKNIAFLMNKHGEWSLSPAFDVTYSYNPESAWTASHQMTMNGKRAGFTHDDFRECARTAGMKQGRSEAILREVCAAVTRWQDFAHEAGVEQTRRDGIWNVLKRPSSILGQF